MKKRISLAAAGLVLVVGVPTSVAAAPAVAAGGHAVADGTSVASATGSVGAVPAVKKKTKKKSKKKSGKKSKKRVTIAWKTVKHKTSRKKGHKKYKGYHYTYTENLRVPYLKGASKKAKKTFDKAVNKKIKSLRSYAKPSLKKYKEGCKVWKGDCTIIYRHPMSKMSKAGSAVYKGRYASVHLKLKGYKMFGGDVESYWATGITVDVRMAKVLKQKSFVKVSKKKLNSELKRTIKKTKKFKRQWRRCSGYPVETCYWEFMGLAWSRSWSVSKKGMTFIWFADDSAGYRNGKVTIPWKKLRK